MKSQQRAAKSSRRDRRYVPRFELLEDRSTPAFLFTGPTFEGIANQGLPPDPHLAAGPNHLLTVVNTNIDWYTKTGWNQGSDSLNNFFASLRPTPFLFDPKVLYDVYENRFVVVTLELLNTSPFLSSRILLAVSDDSDPNCPDPTDYTTGWHFHAIDALQRIDGDDHWADYPAVGLDDQAVYISVNMHEFGSSGDYTTSRLWILPKHDPADASRGIYSESNREDTARRYNPAGAVDEDSKTISRTLQPAYMYPGISRFGTFLVSFNGDSDLSGDEFFHIITVSDPVTAPRFHYYEVNVGNIDNRGVTDIELPDAPQAGSGARIDTGRSNVFSAVYRDGKLWAGTTVEGRPEPDTDQATAHWIEFNMVPLEVGGSGARPLKVQQGNISGDDIADGTHTFYPAVAVDADGNMGLGFAASGRNIFPGAYFTARHHTDPHGETLGSIELRAGQAPYIPSPDSKGRRRWGDYSGIAVDPVDERTFWVFNEYALTPPTGSMASYGTALGMFSFAGPAPQIRGAVWHDLNADGIRQADEPGLATSAVYLDLDNNDVLDLTHDPWMLPNADGSYAFTNIGPGTYAVREVLLPGWQRTAPLAQEYTVTVSSGHDAERLDFGRFQFGAIQGVKFHDQNANGVRDLFGLPGEPFPGIPPGYPPGYPPGGIGPGYPPGYPPPTIYSEPGLPNFQIFLDINHNLRYDAALDLVATTDANGNYSLTGIPPGTYTLAEIPSVEWKQTAPAALLYDVTINSGATRTGFDFGNVRLGAVSGIKWHDANANRELDIGEFLLPGWQFFADRNGDGTFNEYHETVGSVDMEIPTRDLANVRSRAVATGLTGPIRDLDVILNIDHNNDADLTAYLVSPAGTRVRLFRHVGGTGDNFAGTVLDDENKQPIASGTAPFSGRYRPEQKLLSFDDEDPNGIWVLEVADDNEISGDGVIRSWSLDFTLPEPNDVTDAYGGYTITGLPAGTHDIGEVQQFGWVQTYPHFFLPHPTFMHTVSLAWGQFVNHVNFGNQHVAGEIRGIVWDDQNGNRILNEGEPGLADWPVYLDLNQNGRWDKGTEPRQTTDVAGSYRFADLLPGDYEVAQIVQGGWAQTFPKSITHFVTLGIAEIRDGVNFGNQRLGKGDTAGPVMLSAVPVFPGAEASPRTLYAAATESVTVLQAQIRALFEQGVLNHGQAGSLIVKLYLTGTEDDIGKVESFRKEVRAFLLAGILTNEQADALLGPANMLLVGVTRR